MRDEQQVRAEELRAVLDGARAQLARAEAEEKTLAKREADLAARIKAALEAGRRDQALELAPELKRVRDLLARQREDVRSTTKLVERARLVLEAYDRDVQREKKLREEAAEKAAAERRVLLEIEGEARRERAREKAGEAPLDIRALATRGASLAGKAARSARELFYAGLDSVTVEVRDRGDRAIGDEDPEARLARWTARVLEKPDDCAAWVEKGLANGSLDRSAEAVEDFSRAIELNPSFSFAWSGRGHARIQLDEWEAARADLDEALRHDPSNTHALLGRSFVRADYEWDHHGAILDARRALGVDPSRDDARRVIARCHQVLGHAGSFLAASNELVERAGTAKHLAFRAESRLDLDDARHAAVDAERALDLDPSSVAAHLVLGRVHLRRGDRERAETEFEQAARLNGAGVDALLDVATARQAEDDVAGATRACEHALEADPGHVGAAARLAWLLLQGGDPGACAVSAAELVARVPGELEARAALAYSCDRLGRTEELLAHARVVHRDRPKSSRGVALAVLAGVALGRPAEALPLVDATVEAAPWNAHARWLRSWIHLASGDVVRARSDLDAIRAEWPEWEYGAVWSAAVGHEGPVVLDPLATRKDAIGSEARLVLGRLAPEEFVAAARSPADAFSRHVLVGLVADARGDLATARRHYERAAAPEANLRHVHLWARTRLLAARGDSLAPLPPIAAKPTTYSLPAVLPKPAADTNTNAPPKKLDLAGLASLAKTAFAQGVAEGKKAIERYKAPAGAPPDDRKAPPEKKTAVVLVHGAPERIAHGDLDGALSACNRAIRRDPDEPAHYVARGIVRLARGDLEGAENDASFALTLRAANALALALRSSVRRLLRDLDGSLSDAEESRRLEPSSAFVAVQCGKARLERRDPEGALLAAEDAVRREPADAAGYVLRGRAQRALGKCRDARDELERALALAKDAPLPQEQPGQLERALAACLERLWVEGDLAIAREELAELLLASGELEEALARADEALALDPSSATALRVRATARILSGGAFAASLADAEAALALEPDEPAHRRARAMARLEAGLFAGALDDLDAVLAASPTDAAAWAMRGRIAALDGDRERALADLAKAAEHAPGSPWPRVWSAALSETAPAAEAPPEVGERNEVALFAHGRLTEEELFAWARAESDATERARRLGAAHAFAGLVAERASDLARAREHYERCLAHAPGWPEASWARARLRPPRVAVHVKPAEPASPAPASDEDRARLEKLRDAGVLTAEEFEEALRLLRMDGDRR